MGHKSVYPDGWQRQNIIERSGNHHPGGMAIEGEWIACIAQQRYDLMFAWQYMPAVANAAKAFERDKDHNDCPKCKDVPVTWANIRVGRYCDKHQGEIMQAIRNGQT